MTNTTKVTRDFYNQYMVPCYNPMPMVMSHGQGCLLFDTDGKRYIDFTSGVAVNSMGHNHPEVTRIIAEQAKKLIHVSNIFVNEQTLTLAKKLCEATDFTKVFFTNSGTEANEAAFKLARRYAFNKFGEEKNEIISFTNSFHGRTFFSVCVGGQNKYSDGFGPKPAAIRHLPFNDVEAFKAAISDSTCAVMLEIIQGEGGIIQATPEFLRAVRELTKQHQALMIIDEVQTGIGRTGYFYAYQGTDIIPDIITSAKGLGAGMPIGAILTTDEVAEHFTPGTHGSTFGGNPLACSVGNYVVDTVNTPTFLQHVRDIADYMRTRLQEVIDSVDGIHEVRGQGLLLGLALEGNLKERAGEITARLAENGLLTLVASANVVRLAPALIIDKAIVDEGIEILKNTFATFK